MESSLYGFQVNDATWLYLSFLLILSVFFRFGRLISLRNIDLALLLAPSPGILLLRAGNPWGDVWLFIASGLFLVRLLADPFLERRPRIEPNLNSQGLAFLGVSAFFFLTTIVLTSPPPASTVETVRRADQMIHRRDVAGPQPFPEAGPAGTLLAAPVVPLSTVVVKSNSVQQPADSRMVEILASRILAILAHAAVVGGLFQMSRRHFGETSSGIAMATLYLLLPCTAYDVGKVNHVLPAALIVWAFVFYRRPLVSGSLLGLACGTLVFPVFLLPVWAAYYGRREATKFGLALCSVAAVLLGTLMLTSADSHSFTQQTIGSIEWRLFELREAAPSGFWSLYDSSYRIPVIVAFGLMVVSLTIWPRTKSFETLLASSTAIVVSTLFWYPQQGGVYLLWSLPTLLLVMFRPKTLQILQVDSQGTVVSRRNDLEQPNRPVRRVTALSGAVQQSRL